MSHSITDKCTGCSVCSMKCPAGAIYGEKKKQFYIDRALCMDCHVCGWWCAQSAILDGSNNVVQRKKPKEMPKAHIFSEDCNGCGNCSSICPFDCIDFIPDSYTDNFHNNVARVNEKKCVGCGLCEEVCIKNGISVSEKAPPAESVKI